MSMIFKDDEPIACDICDNMIYPGDTYYKFNNENCCNMECLGKSMIEKYWGEVSIEEVLSKEDKESIFLDIRVSEMKDDYI